MSNLLVIAKFMFREDIMMHEKEQGSRMNLTFGCYIKCIFEGLIGNGAKTPNQSCKIPLIFILDK